jgi:hypothetical protein
VWASSKLKVNGIWKGSFLNLKPYCHMKMTAFWDVIPYSVAGCVCACMRAYVDYLCTLYVSSFFTDGSCTHSYAGGMIVIVLY